VQDGKTGETKDLAYTQCKIVGNGSFGVVFQTKLSPSGEDAAIKRVLQDKRFKVGSMLFPNPSKKYSNFIPRTESFKSCALYSTQTLLNSRLSTIAMAKE
jgi:hypothetical protein